MAKPLPQKNIKCAETVTHLAHTSALQNKTTKNPTKKKQTKNPNQK